MVEGPLGEGGSATALRVRDLLYDVSVALKLVDATEASRDLLQREFFALRAFNHPRITRVHDFGYWRDGGRTRAFYTASLVVGVELATFARGGDWASLLRPLADVLSALGSLHRRGLAHGDVTPRNVLVEADGHAVLIDLGCTRRFDGPPLDEVSGTPGFLAPELLRGRVHRTSDLHALGATIRALGVPLPAVVARVVAQLAAERPEDRPQSAEEAAELLGVPWCRPPASDLLGSALVGREEAMASVRSLVDALARGLPSARVVSISGEEGTGKSRLLEETKAEAQLRSDAILVHGDRPRALETALSVALGEPVSLERMAALLRAIELLAERPSPTLLLIDDADQLSPLERGRLEVVVRSIPQGKRLAIVVTSRRPIDGAASLTISALDESLVRRWLHGEVPDAAVSEIVRASGGFPREIAAIVRQLDGNEWSSRVVERAIEHAGTRRGRIDLGGLDEDARDLLARVVAAGPRALADDGGSRSPPDDRDLFDSPLLRRLVVRAPDGLRLLRRSDEARIASALGDETMKAAHRHLADEAEAAFAKESNDAEHRATWIRHLAHVDLAAATRALLAGSKAHAGRALRAAADVVVSVGGSALSAEALRCCAQIHADAGEPALALALAVRAIRTRPGKGERTRLRQLAGLSYAQMGDSRRAILTLRRSLPGIEDDDERARVAAALSLALLKRGADAEALRVVEAALEANGELDPSTRLDLLVNAAFATSRAGKTAAAREHLAGARAFAEDASPRARFRLASASAFVAYGAGETPDATRSYEEALSIAETHGLDDLAPSAALNYGTASHEQGELGRALDAYERGRRLAVALGMPTTEATLSFDLAKVHADIGNHRRAALLADGAKLAARREKMPLLEAGAFAILAEVAAASGDHEASERDLDAARALLVDAGANGREWMDLGLQRARAALLRNDLEGAARHLASTKPAPSATPDVEAAWRGVSATLATLRGRAKDAIGELERALALAEPLGQRSLLADLETRLSDAYRAAGSAFLADRHRARARALWEKTLAGLPEEHHAAFRKHPSRERVFVEETPRPARRVEASLDLKRLLEINRRLNSAADTTAILEETMDAAISLTSGERGFLLLRERIEGGASPERADAPLRVAVARNLDRETLRKGHLKFSRTVAERVVRTGEAVVAVDAAFDPRFEKARSVHAMRLKSLLCVPIRSPHGVLGAIYVDHRFEAGGFAPELADLLASLADQAALAIVKARLVEELRSKTRELEEKNADIERLARGQAIEIARLKRTIEAEETKGPGGATRFDYGNIVAGSAPMRRILGVLDRVIDADITVLVRGESGTGKERIARAIHANSGRSRGPFVAINCGALPETLLEAELFGYRRGAFSGATRDHPGLFASARGGTLFLDELGEMPASMQVKLLRVLQEREVNPLGANQAVPTDVRLVCATNRVLAEEVRAGRFREDLYYRVAVVEVELPPLRERLEDILPLADAILERLATELARPRASLDRSAERALLGHAWPGNVRELENVLTKGFLLASGTTLGGQDLELGAARPAKSPAAALRTQIANALEEADWNVVVAARTLGMPRATIYRKMRRFGLERPPRQTG